MGLSRFVEARHDFGGFEHSTGIRGYEEPGVVIDGVQDLHLGAAREAPVGDVGLPPFVRLLGFEPDLGAPQSLLGLRGDDALTRQDPPDRCHRRSGSMPLDQVERDRVRAGIQAAVQQVLAELDDDVARQGGTYVVKPDTAGGTV